MASGCAVRRECAVERRRGQAEIDPAADQSLALLPGPGLVRLRVPHQVAVVDPEARQLGALLAHQGPHAGYRQLRVELHARRRAQRPRLEVPAADRGDRGSLRGEERVGVKGEPAPVDHRQQRVIDPGHDADVDEPVLQPVLPREGPAPQSGGEELGTQAETQHRDPGISGQTEEGLLVAEEGVLVQEVGALRPAQADDGGTSGGIGQAFAQEGPHEPLWQPPAPERLVDPGGVGRGQMGDHHDRRRRHGLGSSRVCHGVQWSAPASARMRSIAPSRSTPTHESSGTTP